MVDKQEIREQLTKWLAQVEEARLAMRDAQEHIQQLAYECSYLSVKEAYKLGLIRFNFPTVAGFRKAMRSED